MTTHSPLFLSAFVLVLGCGPDVVPTAQSESSSASSTAAAASTTGDSISGPDGGPTSTSTTDVDDTSSTSTTNDDAEGSTTEALPCCEPDAPITFDTTLPAGFTPAEALALFQGVEASLAWVAYEGMPETVLHVDAAYMGGEVLAGPGGFDCTLFINVPCNDGITMDVELTLLSDDGALDWTVPARIEGRPDATIRMEVELAGIAGNAGTLATWPLQVRGRPVVLDAIDLFIQRYEGGPATIELVGHSTAGDEILLATE